MSTLNSSIGAIAAGIQTYSSGGDLTPISFVDATSWTPTIQIGGSSTGITYSNQTGFYTRIGNLIAVYFNITLSSKGASTGTVSLSNLPVAAGPNGSAFSIFCVYAGITFSATQVGIRLMLNNSSAGANFQQYGGAETSTAVLANTNIANTSLLQGYGTYLIV